MVLFLVLIMFLIIGCFIKIKLNIKIEESVFIAFFGSVLVFYVFGLFNILVVGFYFLILLFIFSLGYVIYNFIKSRVNIHEVLTLPIIIYIILMIIIFYKVKDLSYIYYDEFMFWGTNLKTMFSYDLLWAEKSIDGIHLVYPPFTAIAEYIFCKINTIFSEGVTYFAIISLILTSFLPIFKKEKYCIKSLIKIILSILVVYFTINYEEITPSYAQAIKIRKLSEKHELTFDVIEKILDEKKGNQNDRISFNKEKIESVLPKELLKRDKRYIEQYIIKALESYNKKV